MPLKITLESNELNQLIDKNLLAADKAESFDRNSLADYSLLFNEVDLHEGSEFAISKATYEAGMFHFQRAFRSDLGFTLNWGRSITIEKEDFTDLFEGINLENTESRFIAIYLGLRPDNSLIYGIRILKGIKRTETIPDTFDLNFDLRIGLGSVPSHTMSSSNPKFSNANLEEWLGHQTRYYKYLTTKRCQGGANGERLKVEWDPKVIIFPWEAELCELFKQNKSPLAPDDIDYRFQMNAFAPYFFRSSSRIPFEGSNGLRHTVAFHIQQNGANGWEDKLKVGSSVSALKSNAADFGNICPPRCKEYVTPIIPSIPSIPSS